MGSWTAFHSVLIDALENQTFYKDSVFIVDARTQYKQGLGGHYRRLMVSACIESRRGLDAHDEQLNDEPPNIRRSKGCGES